MQQEAQLQNLLRWFQRGSREEKKGEAANLYSEQSCAVLLACGASPKRLYPDSPSFNSKRQPVPVTLSPLPPLDAISPPETNHQERASGSRGARRWRLKYGGGLTRVPTVIRMQSDVLIAPRHRESYRYARPRSHTNVRVKQH